LSRHARGLVAGIHAFVAQSQDVDGRTSPAMTQEWLR
jgi:hypothetical protein